MLGLLDQAGYTIVEQVEQAQVIIVNTCAFIEPAQEEAIDALLDLAEHKQDKCRALICAGCLTQRHGTRLLTELPEVDAFVTVGGVPRIVEAVQKALAGERAFIDAPLSYLYDGSSPRLHTGPKWLAYLKIADGCGHRCAFCIIPQLRGAYRSVRPEMVGRQLHELAQSGVLEVLLIAQDTSAYGRELRPESSLTQLLDHLRREPYDGWLRLLYLHPATLDEQMIAQMSAGPPVLPYFDIPLQHASRDVLRAMGRPGDAETYLDLIHKIRRGPEACVRTTFIVGFPGETQRDFETLLQFVAEAGLDRVSVFRYWPEAGTRAAQMPDQVPIELADERLDQLMQVQEEISLKINQSHVGRQMRVLLESPIERSELWLGRTFRDAPEVDGQIKVTCDTFRDLARPGRFVDVEVTAAEVHDLRGRITSVS